MLEQKEKEIQPEVCPVDTKQVVEVRACKAGRPNHYTLHQVLPNNPHIVSFKCVDFLTPPSLIVINCSMFLPSFSENCKHLTNIFPPSGGQRWKKLEILEIYLCYFFQLVLIFGPFWVILGPFWQFWVIFGPLWAILGNFWAILGHFSAIFWC